MTDQFASHFIRTLPIIGESLQTKRVALLGMPVAQPIVEHMAACGVGQWVIGTTGLPDEQLGAIELCSALQAQHGAALALDIRLLPMQEWATTLRRILPDLVIAVGDQQNLHIALDAATAAGVPALVCMPPGPQSECWAEVVFPGQCAHWRIHEYTTTKQASSLWDWHTAVPLLAGLARALLLQGSAYARPDLEALWSGGLRHMALGAAHPLDVNWTHPNELSHAYSPRFQTPLARRGALLVVGLGSIGSVAAALLAPHVSRLILADPDCVDPANPARQHYTLADLGRSKAQALQERLAGRCPQVVGIPAALTDQQQVGALINQHGITGALVATGTNADFAIARALQAAGVPHVVARCYSRARYWESVLVDGLRSPGLDAIRGHIHYGPAPAPTPEQLAAYSDAGALEAEPATLIESGWAAAWAARLAQQLLMPAGLRERWILELLESQQTCLIGGAYVEQTSDGPAYAIDIPGRIRAWGVTDIVGAV